MQGNNSVFDLITYQTIKSTHHKFAKYQRPNPNQICIGPILETRTQKQKPWCQSTRNGKPNWVCKFLEFMLKRRILEDNWLSQRR